MDSPAGSNGSNPNDSSNGNYKNIINNSKNQVDDPESGDFLTLFRDPDPFFCDVRQVIDSCIRTPVSSNHGNDDKDGDDYYTEDNERGEGVRKQIEKCKGQETEKPADPLKSSDVVSSSSSSSSSTSSSCSSDASTSEDSGPEDKGFKDKRKKSAATTTSGRKVNKRKMPLSSSSSSSSSSTPRGMKLYSCDWCDRKAFFKSGQGLRFHKTLRCPRREAHLGQSFFKCFICNKAFVTTKGLEHHRTEVHPETLSDYDIGIE